MMPRTECNECTRSGECLMSDFDEILAIRQSLCTHSINRNFSIRHCYIKSPNQVFLTVGTSSQAYSKVLHSSLLWIIFRRSESWKSKISNIRDHKYETSKANRKPILGIEYSALWAFSFKMKKKTRKNIIEIQPLKISLFSRYSLLGFTCMCTSSKYVQFSMLIAHTMYTWFFIFESFSERMNNNENRWRADQVNADCRINWYIFLNFYFVHIFMCVVVVVVCVLFCRHMNIAQSDLKWILYSLNTFIHISFDQLFCFRSLLSNDEKYFEFVLRKLFLRVTRKNYNYNSLLLNSY